MKTKKRIRKPRIPLVTNVRMAKHGNWRVTAPNGIDYENAIENRFGSGWADGLHDRGSIGTVHCPKLIRYLSNSLFAEVPAAFKKGAK